MLFRIIFYAQATLVVELLQHAEVHKKKIQTNESVGQFTTF